MGWRIVWAGAAAVLAMVAAILATSGADDDGLLVALRATARVSLGLFVLAISASSLHRLWRTRISSWLLKNRRYIGVTFAVSHTVHFALIAWRVTAHPDAFWEGRDPSTLVGGGLAYAFVAFMAVTSSRRARRRLGRTWTIGHKIGVYVIWMVFLVASARGLELGGAYAVPVALLAATMLLRIAARIDIWRARRARAAGER